MAANCWLVPSGMLDVAGVIAMETSNGGPTVNPDDPEIVAEVAVIVVLPWPTVEAKPEPLTPATPGEDEVQVTEFVRFCVLPFV